MGIQSKYRLPFVLSVVLLVSGIALSAPFFDAAYAFTQPDGSGVTLILNGDEFYMRAETLDGFTAVRDRQTGWICYAELSADGSAFISTGVPVTGDAVVSILRPKTEKELPNGKVIHKKLKIKDKAKLQIIKLNQEQLFGDDVQVINGLPYPAGAVQTIDSAILETPLTAADISAQAAGVLPPTKTVSNFTGTIRGLVLVFDFSDAPASYTLQQYTDKVNAVNSHYGNGNAASLRTYYEDVSRGVFLMDHFVYGIYRAPETFAYYDSLGYGTGAQQLMSYALNDMESSGFDFSQLSTFSNGEIRALAVMYTGSPAEWAQGMWYHQGWWSGFSADGVHTNRYCTDTANDLNPGTLIHEHGHMAAEWPDTYSYIGGEPGTWGVMGGGYCDLPNPYFLYENGWLDAENIMDIPGLKTMNSTDAHFAYFYYDPAQPTEFFIIRPYVNSLLYCPDIPDQGMTFWRINTQGDNANYPDTDRHIELVHANNSDTNKTSNVCFKEGGLLDHFATYTTPSSDWKFGVNGGLPSGLEATDISAADTSMTFILGAPPEPVPYYPLNGSFSDVSGSGLGATGYEFSGIPWSVDIFEDSYFDLGQSLGFDGIDDYVVCPSLVSASDALTVAFWLKPEAVGDMIALDKFPADASGAGWSIRLSADGKIDFLIGSQTNYTQVTTLRPVYETNRWIHAACTYENGTARIFINGALRMVKQGIWQTPNTTALNVQMGIASQVNTDQIYQGLMDDIRFYDTALETEALNAIDGLNIRPDKGLMAYLTLDETSGTLAADASGHGNNGTLYNGVSFNTDSVNGPVDNALSFDGTDEYIALPAGMRQRNGGFTAALWAYPTAVKTWARFIDFGNGSAADNILLSRYSSTNSLVLETFNGSSSGGYVIASNAISLNQWQFFAVTVDGSGNVKLYKNGQVVQTGTSAAPPEVYRRNLYIGRSNWTADSYYEGAMDDIRIYNYTLSNAEILDIYERNRMDGPLPFSGSSTVSPEVVLGFTPAGQAVQHDIYFGTAYGAVAAADTQSPEYAGRKLIAEYNPPNLNAWQDYFWRVDEVMADGTVQPGPVWRFSTIGSIQRQTWTGLSGANDIASLTGAADYPDNPSVVTELETFEIPTNWAESYGTRVHGLLVPQTSGNYQFWISGDNEVELWLSSDDDPANLSLIAYIHGTWSGLRNFDQYTSQQSGLIPLEGGQPYAIMALHKEGDGGDHMAVAWQGPDSPSRTIIDNFWLRPPVENEWPRFVPGFIEPLPAVEGRAFSDVITAEDPDFDAISYSKQAGPGWLTVSSDGQLSGTPENRDNGMNAFRIRAEDGQGAYDELVLSVDVSNRFTGSMGLADLVGFSGEWLSNDPDSPANLDAVGGVDLSDFSQFGSAWNDGIVPGLAAYWSLDDGVGLTARDNYGDLDGILTNMSAYQWVSGMLHNALSFDGVDDYVKIPGYLGITGGSSRTCTAWIKTDNSNAGEVVSWGANAPGQKWLVTIGGGAVYVYVHTGYVKGTTFVADGNWHHVAVVLEDDGSPNADEIRLYVDGVEDTISDSGAYAVDTGAAYDVQIGQWLGDFYSGLIDEVRIYDRALNETEIQELN